MDEVNRLQEETVAAMTVVEERALKDANIAIQQSDIGSNISDFIEQLVLPVAHEVESYINVDPRIRAPDHCTWSRANLLLTHLRITLQHLQEAVGELLVSRVDASERAFWGDESPESPEEWESKFAGIAREGVALSADRRHTLRHLTWLTDEQIYTHTRTHTTSLAQENAELRKDLVYLKHRKSEGEARERKREMERELRDNWVDETLDRPISGLAARDLELQDSEETRDLEREEASERERERREEIRRPIRFLDGRCVYCGLHDGRLCEVDLDPPKHIWCALCVGEDWPNEYTNPSYYIPNPESFLCFLE